MPRPGLKPTDKDVDTVLGRLSRISPFDDVPAVLSALAQDYRLAPISNTDDDLVAGTLSGLGPVFATTITAEQARAYKPNPELFRFAYRKLDVALSDVLHVAQRTFSDLAVCAALGIRVVWVDRQDATLQQGLQSLAIVEDLSGLPETVASL